jgi:hypothetical protein
MYGMVIDTVDFAFDMKVKDVGQVLRGYGRLLLVVDPALV